MGTEGLVQPGFRAATLGLGRWVGEPRSKEAAGGASGVTPSLSNLICLLLKDPYRLTDGRTSPSGS